MTFDISILKGFNYDKFTTYEEVRNFILNTELDVHELGLSSSNQMIYGLSVGDLSKPMILIDGVMHGAHEWRNLHWVKEFAERFDNPPDDRNKIFFEELKREYCLMVVPCLNPYGYINDDYRNANGINLNRNFPVGFDSYVAPGYDEPGSGNAKGTHAFSEPESQIIKNLVETYRIAIYVNTHTSGGYYGYSVENASGMLDSRKVLVDEFGESMKLNFPGMIPSNEDGTRFYGPIVHRNYPEVPWVTEWLSREENNLPHKPFALIFESGSLETKEKGAEIGMTGLFLIIKHVHEYIKTGNLIAG